FSVYRQAITPESAAPQPGQLVFLRVDKLERLADQITTEHKDARLVQVYRRGPVALIEILDSRSAIRAGREHRRRSGPQ
ncbi:MAG: hypothetical protein WBG92_17105, partial [Thiohalocapsa sp.]